MGARSSAQGLAAACHPLPSVAVTGFASTYAVSIGLAGERVLLLAAAVLAGQLSIGWSNDAVDAVRDTTSGRLDKPIPAGLVGRRTVALAAAVAAVACVGLSLALGVAAGTTHIVAVVFAWAYNARLKSTLLSPVPYGVSFGLLVCVATLSLPTPQWPPVAVIGAAASLGVAAHFANTVGDSHADAVTGIRGLPQRIGPRASLVTTAVLVALAAGLLLGGAGPHDWPGVLLLLGGVVLAAGGVLLGGRAETGRIAFRLTLAAVALVVLGFVT
jgi:4-hydroxybenzoate polyprenyltransferase